MTEIKIAVLGLGYVGLPVAMAFAKYFGVVGFDLNKKRVDELKNCTDTNLEFSKNELKNTKIKFTVKKDDLKSANFFIVTVPTPIYKNTKPNLTYLHQANVLISRVLKKNDTVVYESTIYPGCTMKFSVPTLEKSGLILNKDFWVGYSPERINPGDKKHSIENIIKIVSGSNKFALDNIENLYKKIIQAGVFRAKTIEVAEAAKAIENTQRDINIAFMNECAMIFDKLNINSKDVFDAAKTKWNFLNFDPGLVGGHCIGVDPFYLTHAASEVGYKPNIILSGRKTNDKMGEYVANKFIKEISLVFKSKNVNRRALVLGLTFKENCPDERNSMVPKIISKIENCGISVDTYDPYINKYKYRQFIKNTRENFYEGIIFAVKHDEFISTSPQQIKKMIMDGGVVFDVKNLFNKNELEANGINVLQI